MNDEFEKFLVDPDTVEPQRFTEVPPSPPPIVVSKASSGYTPMSQIELAGQAYRGVTSGTLPWWMLILATLVFVGPGLGVTLVSGSFIALLTAILPLTLILRGVHAKLIAQKQKERRRSRRETAMRE